MSDYLMDYIEDKDTYRAVMFARKMVREGTYPGKATKIAASYYGAPLEDVRHYLSQCGGRSKKRR